MKHYNIFALQGEDTTDQEVCDQLGLPQKLANTPEINEAAIMKMHKENVEGYIDQGYSKADAQMKADQSAANARMMVSQLMKK